MVIKELKSAFTVERKLAALFKAPKEEQQALLCTYSTRRNYKVTMMWVAVHEIKELCIHMDPKCLCHNSWCRHE